MLLLAKSPSLPGCRLVSPLMRSPPPRRRHSGQVVTPAPVETAAGAAPDATPKPRPRGYGHPPDEFKYKPGQSGNKNGRPKNARGLKAITKKLLSEKVAISTGGRRKKVSRIEALVMKLIEQASKGDIRALQALMSLYTQAAPEDFSPHETDAASEMPLTLADDAILALMREELLHEVQRRLGAQP